MDDVAAMIAGKTGKIMPMDEESPSNCSSWQKDDRAGGQIEPLGEGYTYENNFRKMGI